MTNDPWGTDFTPLITDIVHNAELNGLVQVLTGLKAKITSSRFAEAVRQAAARSGASHYRIEGAGDSLGALLALLSIDELKLLARQLRAKSENDGKTPFISTPELYHDTGAPT